MGAQSGSVVNSGPSSFFESSNYSGSNCSVKSRAGTSSSNSSNNYEDQKEKEMYRESDNLLNSSISSVYIGIEPIGTKVGHLISNSISKAGIKNYLPTYLGGSTFTFHASVFLKFHAMEPTEGVILEYGGYRGGDSSYKNYIHYAEEDGLRFSKMSYEDYKKKIHNGLKGSQIIEHLDRTILYYTLGKLIDECSSNCKKSWRKDDYNLSSHNCQDFVVQVIEILVLKRDQFKDPSYGRHNYSLAIYPPIIVKALEKNEKEYDEDLKVLIPFQSVPILGPSFEGITSFIADKLINKNN